MYLYLLLMGIHLNGEDCGVKKCQNVQQDCPCGEQLSVSWGPNGERIVQGWCRLGRREMLSRSSPGGCWLGRQTPGEDKECISATLAAVTDKPQTSEGPGKEWGEGLQKAWRWSQPYITPAHLLCARPCAGDWEPQHIGSDLTGKLWHLMHCWKLRIWWTQIHIPKFAHLFTLNSPSSWV